MQENNNHMPEDIRANVVLPKQSNFKIVAVSDPVTTKDRIDKNYEGRIQKHIETINKQHQVLERDRSSLALEIEALLKQRQPVEYNGERTFELFHSLSGARQQQSLELFQSFRKQGGTYFAFDIETFGDSQDRVKPYGISEISINEYDQKGNLVKEGYNGILRQKKEVIDDLQAEIHKIQQDKYYYNTLPDYKKRSIVDLMRYATHADANDAHAFSMTKKEGITHHSIIQSVFDYKDRVDHGKVIQHMDHYLPYMQSGLDTLKTRGTAPKTALKKVATIMQENQEKFFVSYNGNVFDLPVLQAFADKVGAPLPENIKHLDHMAVINAVYPDSDVLKRQVNPDYQGSVYEKNKLAAMRGILPEAGKQDEAHNATVDTNDTARVVSVTGGHIEAEIAKNNQALQSGFHFHPTHMTWSKNPLTTGQQLFATGGVMSHQEGDESFRMKWDAEKKQWVNTSSGFNKTVINSRSFYQFAGLEDMTGEDGMKKLAFRFFDPDREEVSYIVRQGENAYQELQDFVQNRFYNWENASPHLRQEIQHVAETDRARRRYDRFFSMDGAGKGLSFENGQVVERGTSGYSGLKRMLGNAEIMRQHLESNGQTYRNRVKYYREKEGLTESQAKEKARLVTTEELIPRMDFNSQWNPETKSYVKNLREQDAFFKMYGRLIDEMPRLNEAIQEIDNTFNAQIGAATKIPNVYNRKTALERINQQRDRAIMNYYQNLTRAVGTPEVDRPLTSFESHRLSYFDPEANELRSLNFESAGTAHSNIWNYAKRGVATDHPNKMGVMRGRANQLIEQLHAQGKMTTAQRDHYRTILTSNDSVWHATKEIAMHMRDQNGGRYMASRTEPSLTSNEKIQHVAPEQNRAFIQRAIQDTQNAQMVIQMGSAKGKQLVLGEEMRKHLDILDTTHFSGLDPKNYNALEYLITSMRKYDPSAHIAVAMDTTSQDGNVKVYAYDGAHSTSVQNQLARGNRPVNALEVNMPLIGQSGTHKVGARVINAHRLAVHEDGNIKTISSAEHIARGYSDNMYRIAALRKEGRYEEANKLAQRTLNDQIENMSGIQRNMSVGENDTYRWANNFSDQLKQSHIKLGNAMVEDFFYNGYNGLKLTEDDFYDPDDVFRTDKDGNRVLKRGVELSDVNMNTQHKMLMMMPDWAETRLEGEGIKVFTSSVKAEHVSKGTVSTEDIRQLVPYGSFYNHGRDNMVQYMNAYLINEGTNMRIQGIRGVDRDRLLETERYIATGRGNEGLNVKTAFMTQDELRARIDDMYQSESGRRLLGDVGLLTEDGQLNHLKLPRLYEQQGIIAQDLADALTVDNEKRYAKGNQFTMDARLTKDSIIEPGQRLGTRILDNGYEDIVRYEGTSPARIIQGFQDGEDLVVRWEADPFKLMLDGEKMTDSPVDRRFIQALTGQDDIAAIINPDVKKHKDFGMLMSGDARLLARHVRSLNGQDQQNAIQIIKNGKIGLKWDPKLGIFVDTSFGQKITPEMFDNVFQQLGISNTTAVGGYRVGILEAHLSKVSNYSKIVDSSGKRVISYEDGYNAATGEYEVRKKYARGRDGVQWGHREMGVLQGRGLEKTYEHVHQIMVERGLHDPSKEIGRLTEARNIAESLRNTAQEETVHVDALRTGEFAPLPDAYRNEVTYKGTIFDREAVESAVKRRSAQQAQGLMNEHGYWLQLPSVERTDKKTEGVTVNVKGDLLDQKEINKIFIPFTNVEGADGDIHLRQLQKQIANIYQKADAVTSAANIEDAREAQKSLQVAVRGYVKQSFEELSASTGLLFGDAFKTTMGGQLGDVHTSSASGLFKLMDFETSQRYGDGQHTVISESMAKKMGVYEQLRSGKELYTANVRYPTFHDGAMQFTKLHMSADVKDGEMHTSSFSSMLQNADSDGDYSHIVVMDDDAIQKEWKGAHDRMEQEFAHRWDEHRIKEDPTHPDYRGRNMGGVNLHNTVEGKHIPFETGNTDGEMASKIGKMTIGRASNLNLYMRQIADQYYADDAVMNGRIKEFGRGLEQKLIDAKHGAEPVGLQMIDHIYRGEWDKAMELDTTKFEGMFQKDFHMEAVANEMPMALQRVRNGLYTPGLKFGTSTGISTKEGMQHLIDLLYGSADAKDFGGDNKALGMWYKFLNDHLEMNVDRFPQETIAPIERLTETPIRDQVSQATSAMTHVRNIASDAIGGGISDLGEKIRTSFENLSNMSAKRKAFLGTGLAVAGIAGYNILNTEKPEMHYNNEETSTPRSAPAASTPAAAQPDYSTQNASITVRASGKSIEQEQLSHAVTQGMTNAGMQAGPTRISVNYNDNTNQLNRQWYRDKVRESI